MSHLILQRRNIILHEKIYLGFHWSMKFSSNNFSQKPFNILYIFILLYNLHNLYNDNNSLRPPAVSELAVVTGVQQVLASS